MDVALGTYMRATAATRRLKRQAKPPSLTITSAPREEAPASRGGSLCMLEVSNLTRRFGELVAVDDVSFGVGAGEIVGLVGRNGAGKTTTMRAVMGIMSLDSGSIEWDEHAVTFADRLRFGYMPEERGLYPQMQVLDQVSYFARLHGADGEAAARAARDWLVRLGL